jgi:hypothetical protein
MGIHSLSRRWPGGPNPPPGCSAASFEPVFAVGHCACPASVQWVSVQDLAKRTVVFSNQSFYELEKRVLYAL